MSSIYQHVLFVTDLEPDSEIVADRVRSIVNAKERSKLSVLNVVLDNIIAGGYEVMPLFNHQDEQRELHEHHKKLDEFVKGLNLSVDDADVVEALSTVSGIVDYAKQNNTDLIVIGMHERKGFFESLLGNTATSLLSDAPCDVLTVKIPKQND